MIPAIKIDAVQATTVAGGAAGRTADGTPVRPVVPAGRALATQRDALLFRSEAIIAQSGTAPAPYLAQQIGQLWPSAPPPVAKSATLAYLRNSAPPDQRDYRSSLLV